MNNPNQPPAQPMVSRPPARKQRIPEGLQWVLLVCVGIVILTFIVTAPADAPFLAVLDYFD